MSILNVNRIQPVGGGQTVTINAANISAGSATLTAGTFSGTLSGSVNSTGIITVTTLNATNIVGVTTAGITTAYVTSINEGQLQGYRNMLYNGAMVVNQRGFTSAASTSSGYPVDRWLYDPNNDAVVAIGQSTSAAAQPTGQGFTNSAHIRVTTADSSLAAAQYANIQQRLEGYDLQRIKKGSSNAEPVTLSFWVRSSKIGTYIVDVYDNDNGRQVSKSYTIDGTNTWEKKILTFPADTTGAFDNDNALSLNIIWWLAAGSNFTSGTLNTSWAANTNANRAVGQVNFLDTAGAQFNITGCQLEVGPNATDFEFRSYGDELQLCRRYYKKGLAVNGNNNSSFFITYYGGTSALRDVDIDMPSFRTGPNFSLLNNSNVQYYSYAGAWTNTTLSVSTLGYLGWPNTTLYLYANTDGDGRTKLFRCTNATDVHWVADAEL